MIAIFATSRLRGQKTPFVLEERHRCGGEPLGETDALGCDFADFGRVLGDIWILEQAEGKLIAEHAPYGPVQNRFRYLLVAHGLGQHLPVAVDARRLDVHAGGESEQPRFLSGSGYLLARVQEVDGDVVGHGRPREAHAAAQHVGQHRT